EQATPSPERRLTGTRAPNRGPQPAIRPFWPRLWFRDTWPAAPDESKRVLAVARGPGGTSVVAASHREIGRYWLACEGDVPLLFTENVTNTQRLFGTPNASPFVKDGINDHVVLGRPETVNPAQTGTKAAA